MNSSTHALEQREHDIPTTSHSYALAGGLVAVIALFVAAGIVLGGEVQQFVLAGIGHLPFVLLALVGVLGLRHEWARWVTYVLALLLQGLLALFTINYMVLGLIDGPLDTPEALAQSFPPEDVLLLLAMLVLLVLLFSACSAVLLPQGRERIARWLPIDPHNYTHTIALWLVLFITTSAYAQLILLGGQPPLLTAIQTGAISSADLASRSELGQSLDLIYGLIWMLPLAFVAAGWPLKRTLGTALQRLGMVWPSWRQVVFAVVAAVALAFLMGLFGQGLSYIWNFFGWPETDADAFEQLLGGLVSPVGAVVIGITAGLGEELAVRGLLQPRLGILLSNLAFTGVHAYQYSFDALLVVFVLGLLLGVIRSRTNTSTAVIVHAVYNATSVLASLFGW